MLALLAALSLLGGLLVHPLEHTLEPVWSVGAWQEALPEGIETRASLIVWTLSTLMAAGGIALGVLLYGYRRGIVERFVDGRTGRWIHVLVLRKFYVDEIYDAVVVRPIGWFAERLWAIIDRIVIDRGGVEGSAKLVLGVSGGLRYTQLGVVSIATTATLAGTVVVLLWMVLHG